LTVESIHYKFNLGRIQDVFHIENEIEEDKVISLLRVVNDEGGEFHIDIDKFLPEHCLPKFELNREENKYSNENLWATSIFWPFDGSLCSLDILRFSRLSVKEAMRYFGSDQVASIFHVDQTVCRSFTVTPSLRTIKSIVISGECFWGPIPDASYKGRDGRDLNLEVINTMMVSFTFYNLTN
jgi:hypothetical protein